jgi:hypothetical protein
LVKSDGLGIAKGEAHKTEDICGIGTKGGTEAGNGLERLKIAVSNERRSPRESRQPNGYVCACGAGGARAAKLALGEQTWRGERASTANNLVRGATRLACRFGRPPHSISGRPGDGQGRLGEPVPSASSHTRTQHVKVVARCGHGHRQPKETASPRGGVGSNRRQNCGPERK